MKQQRLWLVRRFWLVGLAGELCATIFFLLAGYKISGWRVRFGRLEADLVVEKGEKVLLVEVKTGGPRSFSGPPERKLDAGKVQNLAAIARILRKKLSKDVSVELFVVDFSKIWPRFRRYPDICLW